MTNSNLNDLPCTFNFMVLVSTKIPSGCLVLQVLNLLQTDGRRKKKQAGREKLAEKHTDDSQNHILFNNDRYRDNTTEIFFEI